MSTDLITYLNYISTWDTESDENINKVINEHNIFVGLGDFSPDSAIDKEFNTLDNLATTLRNETIAADATQIAADAAAIASIWSFGLGMAAFVALEASVAIQKNSISRKSTELNQKLTTVDTDISSQIGDDVHRYIIQYKDNNNLIATKAPVGLDTKACRSILMQFMGSVERRNHKLDASLFKKYAESARVLYNSSEINKVYDALDELNLTEKTDADIKKLMNVIDGANFGGLPLQIIRGLAITTMYYKLNIANKKIQVNAKEAGWEVAEVESSAFGMLDCVGKFIAVVAVIASVIDVVLDIIDIANVVEQTREMQKKLNGPIKESYKSYFKGIRDASVKYKEAMQMARNEKSKA
ncbi:hypothetical protein AA313_de0204767 [Arthrobotrys entomopaga]|nr:hypothetical protein AA313_de0204767 [Arthrobotrys entomopaga]